MPVMFGFDLICSRSNALDREGARLRCNVQVCRWLLVAGRSEIEITGDRREGGLTGALSGVVDTRAEGRDEKAPMDGPE